MREDVQEYTTEEHKSILSEYSGEIIQPDSRTGYPLVMQDVRGASLIFHERKGIITRALQGNDTVLLQHSTPKASELLFTW